MHVETRLYVPKNVEGKLFFKILFITLYTERYHEY